MYLEIKWINICKVLITVYSKHNVNVGNADDDDSDGYGDDTGNCVS